MEKDRVNPDNYGNRLEEPFTEFGKYSYADYLTWEIDGMVELIKGVFPF